MLDNFCRNAVVRRVVDGDTFELCVDLGLNVSQERVTVRLLGVDTPEKRGKSKAAGLHVTEIVASKILFKQVSVQFIGWKKGSFGRWLVKLFFYDNDGNQVLLNDWLVNNGFAEVVKK